MEIKSNGFIYGKASILLSVLPHFGQHLNTTRPSVPIEWGRAVPALLLPYISILPVFFFKKFMLEGKESPPLK